jgi:hypothetical protein
MVESAARIARYLAEELKRIGSVHESALQVLLDTEDASNQAYLLYPLSGSAPAELLGFARQLVRSELPADSFLSRQSRARRARLYFACVNELGRAIRTERDAAVLTAAKRDDISGAMTLRFARIRTVVLLACLRAAGIRYRFFGRSDQVNGWVARASALLIN